MVTDLRSTFDEDADCIKIVGYDMSQRGRATQAYEEAGVAADDVDVIELHDCFSANELITYEALGLRRGGPRPRAGRRRGDDLRRRGWVVNPSGGLISKGHPLGATGLAQCSRADLAAARRPPTRARSRAPTSACSTTSASAAPAW